VAFLNCRKACPRGLPKIHWQSSTWPIQLLYLSTMYYSSMQIICKRKVSPFTKDLHRTCGFFITNMQIISYSLAGLPHWHMDSLQQVP
jgi:hypothetical protein